MGDWERDRDHDRNRASWQMLWSGIAIVVLLVLLVLLIMA